MSKIPAIWVMMNLILGLGLAEAEPIYLTCTGKRTEFSGPWPGANRPGEPDAKITSDENVTASVKIDQDAQTFGWSEAPLNAGWPHCKILAER